MSKLIAKGQEGIKTPNYFKIYGIDGDKFYEMYKALKTKGLAHYPSFMYAWQALKELPKKYYAFGNSYNNVDQWSLHAADSLTGKRNNGIYKKALNASNYLEWQSAMRPFNTHASYWTTWLPTGLNEAESYINQRIALDTPKSESEVAPKIKLDPIVEKPDAIYTQKPVVNKPIKYFRQ